MTSYSPYEGGAPVSALDVVFTGVYAQVVAALFPVYPLVRLLPHIEHLKEVTASDELRPSHAP